MIKKLLLLLIVMAGSLSCFAGEIPFTLEKGFIIVPAKILKDVPVDVAISTGSPYSFLNPELIKPHNIHLRYTAEGPITGSHDKIINYAEVPDVIVADQKPISLNMQYRSFETMDKAIGRQIGAILGADFFKGKIIQIDFKKKVLIFLDKSPIDYQGAVDAKTLVFKMDQLFRAFDARELSLPVVDGTSYNGSKVRTMFDTGTAFPVTISPAATKEFSFGPMPDKGTSKVTQLKTVSLNSLQFSDVPAKLVGRDAGFDESLHDYGAIIGVGVMQNFIVTFDWKEKMLVLGN